MTVKKTVDAKKAPLKAKPTTQSKKAPLTKAAPKKAVVKKTVKKTKQKETAPKDKKPQGRPTDYRKEYDDQAFKYCLLGATDAILGDFFGVSEQTINSWKKEFPTFLESILRGKDRADAEVASALFKRATGFEKKNAVKIFMPANARKPVYAKYDEYYPPDAVAAYKWLHNRKPELWRDKQEISLVGMPMINVGLDLPEDYKDTHDGDTADE